jgi:hypothetical protein
MPCKSRHSEYLRRKERGVVYRHHQPRECERCGSRYRPTGTGQRYCSIECRKREPRECDGCGATYVPKHMGGKFCSRECYLENGCARRYTLPDGYVRVWVPKGTPGRGSGGRMLEHRYVMQESLGRALAEGEYVHHRNGDRADNRIENLQLVRAFHGKGSAHACADCGSRNVVTVTIA